MTHQVQGLGGPGGEVAHVRVDDFARQVLLHQPWSTGEGGRLEDEGIERRYKGMIRSFHPPHPFIITYLCRR